MPDAELFIHLAEIAGVFVGFGSLLAIRSGDAIDVHAVEYLRAMVSGGLWVIVAALAPLVLSRFGLEGRALWVPCSLLALVLFIVSWIIDARSPENRTERSDHRSESIRYAAVAMPMTLVMLTALVLVIVRAWPAQDSALFFLAVTLVLLETGLSLIALVWSQAHRGASHDSART